MKNKSRNSLVTSMIIFGTIGVFVKNINLSSSEIALYRALMASVMIGIYLAINKEKMSLKNLGKQLLLLLISGMAMGFNWIFLFKAYKYTSISIATLTYYFAPVLVIIISPILFKEKLSVKGIASFIGASIGIVFITLTNDKTDGTYLGIVYGLMAAVLYASVILINKYIKDVKGIERTFLQFVSASVVLFPYVLFTDGINIGSIDKTGLINLLILGIIHTGFAYCLYFSSVKEMEGLKVSILSYIDPLVAVLISILLLNEPFSLIQFVGGIMILGFTLYNELSSKS